MSPLRDDRPGDDDSQRWATSEPDPGVARRLRLSGREETLHAERVTEVIAILGQPEREAE
jgi:hypothetical protein